MLFVRNWAPLRSGYVWCLDLASKVFYGTEVAQWQRDSLANTEPVEVDEHSASSRGRSASGPKTLTRRLVRINSELELGGLGEWEAFDAVGGVCDIVSSMTRSRGPGRERSTATGATAKASLISISDLLPVLNEGLDAIVGDTLTRCFESEPPRVWNFLTRHITRRLPVGLIPFWLTSIFVRYFVLLPLRVTCLATGVFLFGVAFVVVDILFRRRSTMKVAVQKRLIMFLASTFVASWGGLVRYHGRRPRRQANQIYVANHTSPIDLIVMLKDYPFSAIGQRHGGLAGRLQDLMSCVQNHVWFDRNEGRDRRIVQKMLQAHVRDGDNEPVIVFPEGTCVNNEYCIMFKKGSFELGAQVYPVAIKYKKQYADTYWNSSKQSFLTHLIGLMTSWAVFCDVYYLEPQELQPGESATDFAKRVKQLICERAGLVETNWDGFLKRHQISPKFRNHRQMALAYRWKRRLEIPKRDALLRQSYGSPSPLSMSPDLVARREPSPPVPSLDSETHWGAGNAMGTVDTEPSEPLRAEEDSYRFMSRDSTQHKINGTSFLPGHLRNESDVHRRSQQDTSHWRGLQIRFVALLTLTILLASFYVALLFVYRSAGLASYCDPVASRLNLALHQLWQQFTKQVSARRHVARKMLAETNELLSMATRKGLRLLAEIYSYLHHLWAPRPRVERTGGLYQPLTDGIVPNINRY